MEALLVKLRKEQEDLKETAFRQFDPKDPSSFMRYWAEWSGLGKAIAFIEEEIRHEREDEDQR